jgi:PHS family inorganic phosphate transporter-like MFS transporter
MSRAFQHYLLLFDLLLTHDRFYGINLNQNVVLQQIGYDGKAGTPWHRLFKISTGGMIITALGFVPGKKKFCLSLILEAKYLIRNDSF